MDRLSLLNFLIEKFNYKTYLEIGVYDGSTFRGVVCNEKESVDPDGTNSIPTYQMTSDDFFNVNKKTYDIIFVDGYHEHQQVKRDIFSSLKILNEGGIIVVHDCSPKNEIGTRVPAENVAWWGDVYKGFLEIRQVDHLDSVCTDFDEGCGIIIKRKNKNTLPKIDINKVTFEDLDKNRNELLNIKTFEEIKNWL